MSTSEKQKVWIALDHSNRLATALAIVSHWGRERFIFNLLISRHPYWRTVEINLYKHQFDEIHILDRPYYIPNPISKLVTVIKLQRQRKRIAQLKYQSPNIVIGRAIVYCLYRLLLYPVHVFLTILKILRVKRRIAQLKIQPVDIIIGLQGLSYLENVMLSMHPKNLKIGIMPIEEYEQSIRPVDTNIYKNTLEGWVANRIIAPITGLHRTYCMRERLHPELTWWIRFQSSLLDIYGKVVVLGNPPTQIGDNIFTMPFPYVLPLKKAGGNRSNKKPKKVVFFGQAFLVTGYLVPPEVYAKNMNAFLAFVREKYGSTYKLVYRPHPLEKSETSLLDLEQFEIEKDEMLAELYLYRNVESIHAVFSVESISSRSAYYFFINAYSFLNISPYDEGMKNYFRLEMGNIPDDFYINDLTKMPNSYIKTEDMNEAIRKCQDVLNEVIRR